MNIVNGKQRGMHRLVIVGGGVAGLDLATQLARHKSDTFQVVLIDREPAHVWKPMLHTIAAGTSDVGTQQTPYLAQARQHGFTYQPGELQSVDRSARTVTLGPLHDTAGNELVGARQIGYDTLILATGSQANDFNTPGVSAHCRTIDSRSQALKFNELVREALFRSLVDKKTVNLVIVGGGATGVELAAELVHLSEIGQFYGAPGLRKSVRVHLVESSDRLLKAFPAEVAASATKRLEALGVDIHTGMKVSRCLPATLETSDGGSLPFTLCAWAAGVKGGSALEQIGLDLTHSGQVEVSGFLRSLGDPAIFALGDCASVKGAGAPPPPTAQAAAQQSQYLVRWLDGLIHDEDVPVFKYKDFGSLVSLGGYGAYGSLGQVGLFKRAFIRGKVAQFGHALLYRRHQARLHGFWRGGLLWLIDMLSRRVRPAAKLD